jgi:hypothetical protein
MRKEVLVLRGNLASSRKTALRLQLESLLHAVEIVAGPLGSSRLRRVTAAERRKHPWPGRRPKTKWLPDL